MTSRHFAACLMSSPEIMLYFESLPANNTVFQLKPTISVLPKPIVLQGEQRLPPTWGADFQEQEKQSVNFDVFCFDKVQYLLTGFTPQSMETWPSRRTSSFARKAKLVYGFRSMKH